MSYRTEITCDTSRDKKWLSIRRSSGNQPERSTTHTRPIFIIYYPLLLLLSYPSFAIGLTRIYQFNAANERYTGDLPKLFPQKTRNEQRKRKRIIIVIKRKRTHTRKVRKVKHSIQNKPRGEPNMNTFVAIDILYIW